jgi:hypothetical protein
MVAEEIPGREIGKKTDRDLFSPPSPTIVRAFARAIRQRWRSHLMIRVVIRCLHGRDRPRYTRNAWAGWALTTTGAAAGRRVLHIAMAPSRMSTTCEEGSPKRHPGRPRYKRILGRGSAMFAGAGSDAASMILDRVRAVSSEDWCEKMMRFTKMIAPVFEGRHFV